METVVDNVEGEHSNSFKSYYVVWKPPGAISSAIVSISLNRTM